MVERVKEARCTTINDLPACREALSKLHNLGIAQGPLRTTRSVLTTVPPLIHNFEGSYRTNNPILLQAEMHSLEAVLLQTADEKSEQPHLNKALSRELGDEIRAVSLRDNGFHPLLWEQAFKDGEITITPSQHRDMLDELRKGGCKKPSVNV